MLHYHWGVVKAHAACHTVPTDIMEWGGGMNCFMAGMDVQVCHLAFSDTTLVSPVGLCWHRSG